MRGNGLEDFAAATVIAAVGAAGYYAFPDNLALLVRLITTAFLVLSLDLVTGYCGVATLGHALLFGTGAYVAGLANVNGITDPFAMLAAGAFAGSIAGTLSGAVIVRVSGLAQLVLSIAIIQLAQSFASKAASITGGSDGLSGIDPAPIAGLFPFDLYSKAAYLLSLVVLILTFLVLKRMVRSPFGLLCRAIKEDPLRVAALGGSPYPALVKMYAVSGLVAGLGGALSAMTAGVVALDSLSFERSANSLVMLALGGTGTLSGALLGTTVFEIFEHLVSAANPFHWMVLVALLLIGVVLFLPKGLQSLFSRAVFSRAVWVLGKATG